MAISAPLNQPAALDEDAFEYTKNTVWRRFRKHKLAMAGAAVLLLMVVVAVFAHSLAPYDPNAIDEVHWQGNPLPPCFQDHLACGGHSLGTDENGRDLLSRLMFGARISLTVGVAAVVMELFIGTVLGMIAGYFGTMPWRRKSAAEPWMLGTGAFLGLLAGSVAAFFVHPHVHAIGKMPASVVQGIVEGVIILVAIVAGWHVVNFVARLFRPVRDITINIPIDYLIMRLTDVFLSIPLLPLLLTLTGIVVASSNKASLNFGVIVVIIGALSWPGVARLVRASYLSLREREYTEAARALGNNDARIMLRHLLPNAIAPIIVQATLDVANVIVLESTLSFLGFGIQPPTASWGNMLANAESNLEFAWWAAVFPGLCILVTVLAINYIGDGLRDALDPNMR
jgi:peptide/nickel transport system permease protein